MSEIRALDKLRNLHERGCGCSDECYSCMLPSELGEVANEIQAEVDSRFMERPCDKNGEPTYIGQRIKHRGHEGEVWLLGVHEVMCSDHVCYPCGEYEHVKPRTLEDVLSDCCNEWNQHCGKDWEQGVYAKYAAEIRELMAGDAE